jgi:hypothetical protein
MGNYLTLVDDIEIVGDQELLELYEKLFSYIEPYGEVTDGEEFLSEDD